MNLSHHGGSCGHSCCLRVENMSVKIGTDCILKDVNLHVHCGEMAAIIGPNGAGKSTFLKAILGQREYEGVIAFSEPGQRSKKPRIGYVPQSPAFDPSDPVSVSDLFACCMSRRPAFLGLGKAMKDTVAECLSRVHGEELVNKRVGTLSGGELQRVLLARALAQESPLLLLDELAAGLDLARMVELFDLLERRRAAGACVLMAMHDCNLASLYATRLIGLKNGQMLFDGPASEIFTEEKLSALYDIPIRVFPHPRWGLPQALPGRASGPWSGDFSAAASDPDDPAADGAD